MEILIKPLTTEKISKMDNKYVFIVVKKANKEEIKKAIQKFYKVKPLKINTINLKGKEIKHGRTIGKRKDWKKAIVTLKKGETIKDLSKI